MPEKLQPTKPVPVDEAQFRAKAKALAAMPPARHWNKGKHIALIAWTALQHGLPEDNARDFKASLAIDGLGGNASQFQKAKWLKDDIDTQAQSLEEYNV